MSPGLKPRAAPRIQIAADLATVACGSLERVGERWFAFATVKPGSWKTYTVTLDATELVKLGSRRR